MEHVETEQSMASIAVNAAIDKVIEMDPEYWAQTLQSRLVSGVGSRTLFKVPEELEDALRNAEWSKYNNPIIIEGCVAYTTTSIPGVMGVEEIQPLSWYTYKEKGGKVFCIKPGKVGEAVDHTILIVGPDGDLWTFHPGRPIRPSESTDLSLVGTTELGQQAMERGFLYAKIVD